MPAFRVVVGFGRGRGIGLTQAFMLMVASPSWVASSYGERRWFVGRKTRCQGRIRIETRCPQCGLTRRRPSKCVDTFDQRPLAWESQYFPTGYCESMLGRRNRLGPRSVALPLLTTSPPFGLQSKPKCPRTLSHLYHSPASLRSRNHPARHLWP